MNKIYFLLLIVFCTACGTASQDSLSQQAEKELMKMDKQTRKMAEAAADSIAFLRAQQALNEREFVLEAERVEFRRGNFAYVNANTNFVSLHGDRATVQLAFNSAYAGPNGIGGITVDGTASNVQMKTDNKGNITFSMMVQGAAISAQVSLRMIKGSNKCTAVVSPTFSGNRITFSGSLYPEEDSNVFKGRSF